MFLFCLLKKKSVTKAYFQAKKKKDDSIHNGESLSWGGTSLSSFPTLSLWSSLITLAPHSLRLHLINYHTVWQKFYLHTVFPTGCRLWIGSYYLLFSPRTVLKLSTHLFNKYFKCLQCIDLIEFKKYLRKNQMGLSSGILQFNRKKKVKKTEIIPLWDKML